MALQAQRRRRAIAALCAQVSEAAAHSVAHHLTVQAATQALRVVAAAVASGLRVLVYFAFG